MRSLRLAWAFLTRMPGGRHPRDGESMAGALPWFPVVGLVTGALTGGAFASMHVASTPMVAAITAIALGAVITGAFHEDGLADTADSFGAYTRERRLEVMRDSRIGTFGALALIFAALFKVAALASLDAWAGAGALVGAHTIGRAGALVVMKAGPDARSEGLAASSGEVPVAVLIVAGLVATAAAAIGPTTALAAAAGLAVALAGVVVGRRHLGGMTGDLLGAVEQCGEVAVLVTATIVGVRYGWTWW